jgi:hypothetical protein
VGEDHWEFITDDLFNDLFKKKDCFPFQLLMIDDNILLSRPKGEGSAQSCGSVLLL